MKKPKKKLVKTKQPKPPASRNPKEKPDDEVIDHRRAALDYENDLYEHLNT